MATTRKKKEIKKEKKRLIISYERLPEKDKDIFDEKYGENYMDFVQTVTRPDGTPMFVVPLETEENIYMIKIDLRVDAKMTEEEFDKEVLHNNKSDQDEISSIDDEDDRKTNKEFHLNHGDYSSLNSLEETAAKEDMDNADFTSLDEVDVADENSMDM